MITNASNTRRDDIRFYILIPERNNSTFILIEQDIIFKNKIRR